MNLKFRLYQCRLNNLCFISLKPLEEGFIYVEHSDVGVVSINKRYSHV